jgi:catechol 2,3-dioxygenase-like lactoylglutathione lyase family enzyme
MKVLFCAGFAPIVSDLDASVAFYGSTLGIPGMHRDADNPDYVATNDLDGLKHLGLWKLSDAAEACFGTNEWPSDVPVPQGTIEFDVEDVDEAAEELRAAGYSLLHEPVDMPWGQRIVHVMSPERLLVGLTFTPWLRAES